MALNLKTTLINKENLSVFVSQVLAGASLQVAAVTPTGYTRQFQHTDWIDFVDPVQAGGNNGFNERFHALESEFDLISGAITSVDSALSAFEQTPPAIGLTLALSIANGATIPIPAGFQLSETVFFAFPKIWNANLAEAGGAVIGFQVFASSAGVVTANLAGTNTASQGLLATGLAISKKGGW
jgi:hypothetical protein